MSFKSLKNLDDSFRQLRFIVGVFAFLCLLISSYAIYQSYTFAEQQREKVYVLDQGKSLMVALSQNVNMNRPVEAREHVRRFHELFFTLAPDQSAINENMKRAFYLADKSAYNYYKDLEEQDYFKRLISGNVYQKVKIDSIRCDFSSVPYTVSTYGKVYIVRTSNITERNLETYCELMNTTRSDNNPQGFIMEHFEVLDNKDLQIIQR